MGCSIGRSTDNSHMDASRCQGFELERCVDVCRGHTPSLQTPNRGRESRDCRVRFSCHDDSRGAHHSSRDSSTDGLARANAHTQRRRLQARRSPSPRSMRKPGPSPPITRPLPGTSVSQVVPVPKRAHHKKLLNSKKRPASPALNPQPNPAPDPFPTPCPADRGRLSLPPQ